MQVYAYELTMQEEGILTLTNLPLNAGERIEVIIIPRSEHRQTEPRYPFWGKPLSYLNPTDPIAEEDWEVLQ